MEGGARSGERERESGGWENSRVGEKGTTRNRSAVEADYTLQVVAAVCLPTAVGSSESDSRRPRHQSILGPPAAGQHQPRPPIICIAIFDFRFFCPMCWSITGKTFILTKLISHLIDLVLFWYLRYGDLVVVGVIVTGCGNRGLCVHHCWPKRRWPLVHRRRSPTVGGWKRKRRRRNLLIAPGY